ncbi:MULTISPECIES: SGNH/GDSL hydrolase family protein [unclassified Spiroplasma]|uniref:SGNH/GDSL hydrolase family protein n=1 Tax=unclassified Spiroplasma TaxID=2637901 RepID=UPI00313E313F
MVQKSNLLKSLFLSFLLMLTPIKYQINLQQNNKYHQLYVLGDSLSDNGSLVGLANQMLEKVPSFLKNYAGIKEIAFKSPYYNNSFSNGPVAVEVLANKLGLSLIPTWFNEFKMLFLGWTFEKLGNNYATSGAQVIGTDNYSKFRSFLQTKISLTYQTTALLQQHQLQSKDLIVIIMGGNDVLWNTNITDKMLDEIVLTQENNINRLINSNAQRIVIGNLPDVSTIPMAKEKVMLSNKKIKIYNEKLKLMIEKVNCKYYQTVKLYDIYALMKKVTSNFLKQGKEIYKSCSNLDVDHLFEKVKLAKGNFEVEFNNYCNINNIDEFLFFDQVHPTKNAHYQLGLELFNLVNWW